MRQHFDISPIRNLRLRPITGLSMDRQTLSIMKACEVVGVSRRTIYNWIAGGKIQYVRTAGGSVRIFADTLWREPDPSADPEGNWNQRLSRGA